MTSSARTQTRDDHPGDQTEGSPAEGAAVADAAGPVGAVAPAASVVAALGIAIVLVASARIGSFDTAFLVGGEVLLTAVGLLAGTAVRRGRRFVRWWSGWLPALWLLIGFTLLYAVAMATPPEVGPIRASTVASMALVTNWWLVFAPQLPLGAPSPLATLWLPAVAVQATAVCWLVVRWHRRRPRTGATAGGGGLPRGAVVAGVGGVVATLWTALLANLAAGSAPGSSPLGDPGALPGLLVRLLNIDGTYDATRIAYGTDTRAAGFLFGVAAAYLLPHGVRRIGQVGRTWALVAGVALLAVLAFAVPIGWILSGGLGVAGAVAAAVALLVAAGPDDAAAGGSGAGRPTDGLDRALRPVAWLGARSWSIYIWILPVAILSATARSGLSDPMPAVLGLVVPVALGLGAAAFVEPALRRATARGPDRTARTRIVCSYGLALVLLGATFFRAGPGLYVYQGADPDGRYPLLFAGDSMPYGLGLVVSGRGLDAEAGFAARLAALPGCGITPGALLNGESLAERSPDCDALMGYMDTETTGSDPPVAIMLAWAWELYDHEVVADGATTVYEVGTPEWRERLRSVAQQAIDELSQEGAVVVLLTMPCVDPDAETPNHPTSVAATEPYRLEAVNDLVRQLADWNRANTVLWDIDGEYLCPDGDYRAIIDGTLMSDDSVHFTEDGAEKIWHEYLEPRLRGLLGVPEGPVT